MHLLLRLCCNGFCTCGSAAYKSILRICRKIKIRKVVLSCGFAACTKKLRHSRNKKRIHGYTSKLNNNSLKIAMGVVDSHLDELGSVLYDRVAHSVAKLSQEADGA
jgi:uncharacterized ferredoxin-like protein